MRTVIEKSEEANRSMRFIAKVLKSREFRYIRQNKKNTRSRCPAKGPPPPPPQDDIDEIRQYETRPREKDAPLPYNTYKFAAIAAGVKPGDG